MKLSFHLCVLVVVAVVGCVCVCVCACVCHSSQCENTSWASLVVQWLRICLAMQMGSMHGFNS